MCKLVCCIALRICSNAFRVLLLLESPDADGKANFFGCVLCSQTPSPSFYCDQKKEKERPTDHRSTEPATAAKVSEGAEASCEFRRCLALFLDTGLKFKSDPYVTRTGNTIKSYIDHQVTIKTDEEQISNKSFCPSMT